MKVTTVSNQERHAMTDQTPETAPDSTILDAEEVVTPDPTAGTATQEDTSALVAAPTSTTDSPAAETAGTSEPDPTLGNGADTSAALPSVPAPTPESNPVVSAVASEVHKFRIVHEIYDATETVLHSAVTSAPLIFKDAVEVLTALAKIGL